MLMEMKKVYIYIYSIETFTKNMERRTSAHTKNDIINLKNPYNVIITFEHSSMTENLPSKFVATD